MKKSISNSFLFNYLMMFLISSLVLFFAFLLLSFAGDMLSKTLTKNNFTAKSIMQDDIGSIDVAGVLENNGGVQIVDEDYNIIYTRGIDNLSGETLTASLFTDFLAQSQNVGRNYSYSIAFNENERFWLIVTFPTSIRIDLGISFNNEYVSKDSRAVATIIISVALFYLILLGISTVIYSRISSIGITKPLKKLSAGVSRFKNGDYSARVHLKVKNEFRELQDTFNSMADRIQQEIALRKKSEENRRKLILDISHDLKNPLSGIMGYSEIMLNEEDISPEKQKEYMGIIHDNSKRANNLIKDMFELSTLDSPDFSLIKTPVDISEYMRRKIGGIIPMLEEVGFDYDFDIPGESVTAAIDEQQMDRVFQNLISNTIRYNKEGTMVYLSLSESDEDITIVFKDDGIGIPKELVNDIFDPFVRTDSARNHETGGTGLGLAIVERVVSSHNGTIRLDTDTGLGCEFIITLPKI